MFRGTTQAREEFVCEFFREYYGVATTETANVAARRFLNLVLPVRAFSAQVATRRALSL